MKKFTFYLVLLIMANLISAQDKKPVTLKYYMDENELKLKHLIGKDFVPTDPPTGIIREIAEFEPMQAVLVRYPFGIPIALIKEMATNCVVTTIVANSSQETTVRSQYTTAGVNLANCNFIHAPSDSYWTRDYGPWFVTYGNRQIGIVDFPYNRPRLNDDEMPKKVAQQLSIPWFGMNLIHTGGNYMNAKYDKGASTTLVWDENPGLSHTQVYDYMHNYMGLNEYIVVQDPNNTYIDHIDCWSKFLDVDKILIRKVPNTHAQYNAIETVVNYFSTLTSPYGTPYKIYRVNNPQNQPYTNSLILNNKVFVPIMNSTWDDSALAVYKAAMPGYTVIGVIGSSSTPWESTDALHCRTRGIADLQLLDIKHMPLLGNQPIQTDYTINACIRPFSGAALIPDSVLLCYQINDGGYYATTMTAINDSDYFANIPGQLQGTKISYYLFAKDAAGKKACHPFIGAPDPYVFYAGSTLVAGIQVNPSTFNLSLQQGASNNTQFSITNTGQAPLVYTITINNTEKQSYHFSQSNAKLKLFPQDVAYSKVLAATFTIVDDISIEECRILYNWTSDSYPEEGTLLLESPNGTIITLAQNRTTGKYDDFIEEFKEEKAKGVWKYWILDKNKDGGHAINNIEMVFFNEKINTQWLTVNTTSDTINSGDSTIIHLMYSAQNITIGNYNATITISSNALSNPIVSVPVNLNVTAALASLTPNIIVFDSLHQCAMGKYFIFSNLSGNNINITNIPSSNSFWFWDSAFTNYPVILPSMQSLPIRINVRMGVKNNDYIFDTLHISTDNGYYSGIIKINSALLSNVNEIDAFQNIEIYPNPVDEWLHLNISTVEKATIQLELFDLQGKKLNSKQWFSNSSPNNTFSINTKQLNSGMYIGKILINENIVKIFKINKK